MIIKMTEFAERRKKLLKKISPTSLVILPAAPVCMRNADCDYPYRQNSDFYYLTGFEEPEAIAILTPNGNKKNFILFTRERNRDEEIWNGYRAGTQGAREQFGADEAFPIHTLESKLPSLLEGRTEIHYALGIDKVFDKVLLNAINRLRSKIRNGLVPPISIIDITNTLHEMRLIKSRAEIATMKQAATISVEAHKSAMQLCKPGINEYMLEAEIQYTFNRNGARFPAYTSIVGSGANTCILHYNANNQPIKDGDLVLIDAGCEYENYASDITRTFPANGKFTAEQKAIYEIVLASQLAAIKTIRPGPTWDTAQTVIVKIITQGLLELGLLKGKLNDLIEKNAYLPFYMHKSGHWLGLDVHDVGFYKTKNKWRKLEAGMVLTVEPGIYISADIPNVPKRWHNIGIRIEDDVVVTPTGHDVLSQNLLKTVEDIEQFMQ